VLLRLYTLPTLLRHLTPHETIAMAAPDVERDRAVHLVLRVCQMRLFRTRLFPLVCLRQSLTIYYTLTRLGYPVTIHFGVRKGKEELQGHCWVTVKGMPVTERGDSSPYRIIYTYPPSQPNSVPDEQNVFSPKEQFLRDMGQQQVI